MPADAWIDTGLMTIISTRQSDEHVVTIYGELDLNTSQRVSEEIRRVERSDAPRITIDLSHLEFIDATGIRTMLHAQARAHRSGGRLSFVRGPKPVDRAFRLTGASDYLSFVD
jgi:anti-anti-sigma factor